MQSKQQTGKSIIKTGMIIILAGAAALLLVMLLMNRYEVLTEDATCLMICNFIADMAKTTITIGGGTVLYSYFDFVYYVSKSFMVTRYPKKTPCMILSTKKFKIWSKTFTMNL